MGNRIWHDHLAGPQWTGRYDLHISIAANVLLTVALLVWAVTG